MPKVSVIVPNYNHAPYLHDRIASILDQTFQDFELVLLDDCSSDNSLEILELYRNHPKVKSIVINEVNSGSTFKQWDKGIALAEGDYIWIAESDDYADARLLHSLVALTQKHPEAGLVYCGSNKVNEHGNLIGEITRNVDLNLTTYYHNPGYNECIDHAFCYPIIPNASAVLFKKDNYSKVNLSYRAYRICGDWQFWIDIFFDNYLIYLPDKLNYFRQSATSVSRSSIRKDTLTIFYLERLMIALYTFSKAKGIPLTNRLKYIESYLFEVLLESFRGRIFLDKSKILFISQSLLKLSFLTPIIVFVSLFRVIWFGFKKIIRRLL